MRLAFTDVKDWRSRWCNSAGSRRLHRVRRVDNRRKWNDYPSGYGETVCGRRGLLYMPGFIGRLSTERCAKCCQALKVPRGCGAPYNDPTCFPPEGKPIEVAAPFADHASKERSRAT